MSAFLIVLATMMNHSHAKCWSMYEIAPTFCVKIRLTEKVKSKKSCVFGAKVLHSSIPRSDIQNKSAVKKFLRKKKINVDLGSSGCKQFKTSDSIEGFIEAVCEDTGKEMEYDYIFFRQATTKVRVGANREEVTLHCGSNIKKD